MLPLFVQTAMVADMVAASIQNIGVDLKPQDIAEQVLKLVQSKGTLFTQTHHPIGLKTKIMYQLSSISPQIINRLGNIFLSRK